MKTDKKELLISHLFDASTEIVFKAWTDPELLRHWYAPDGCTIEFKSIEIIPGGHFHSCIHDPVHGECWVKGSYLEIVPNLKLVFTMVMSDKDGNSVSSVAAGKTQEWPEEQITTVSFEPIGTQTKVTIHQTVCEEEAKKTGAYQSWIKMLNKLHFLLTADFNSNR
ncbi:SRPBCC family protein [Pedobacter psychroterrae]|uniref:SRPBCC domain-containing protein n=1 Tax=Pedobacter psychroterrae TaxID=2530453 RepID=A0A4R0NMH1_9SPHI|nr:SRPBCC domain-containing protein [Pedobacter psychroterrae]TCD01409.1 SRPBCC domain-containing protein [Pedobacter psychroterrae]